MESATFAQVILPLPVSGNFTYSIPSDMAGTIKPGIRVVVPFRKHYYTGLVEDVTTIAPPPGIPLKDVAVCLDDIPVVRNPQVRFWHWISDYYLCTVGDVFKAALPSGMKVESETRVEIDPEASPENFSQISDRELEILGFLKKEGSTPIKILEKKLNIPAVGAVVTRLIDKNLVSVSEKLVERYRAVRRPYVRPLVTRNDTAAMEAAFAAVKRSPKQESALVALFALSDFHKKGTPLAEVPLEVLLERAAITRPIVKSLADKGLCEIYEKEISRFSYTGNGGAPLPVLSGAQNKALDEIHRSFIEKDVVLLHGVTSSGKTEVYIHLIDYVLRKGEQALFLVPEIALTTQLTRRLQRVFGEKVIIYHSKFSDNERVDLWHKLLETKGPAVIIGARSAVFLPFFKLGIVIVDEEHEASYKQYDPAPRYNGRDAAIVLASFHGAKTLLGSATPTVETYHKALSGKFGLVSLTERFGDASLPEIEIVDMKAERRRKAVSGYFSHRLLDMTLEAVGKKHQAILFHNRRGYAPMARCRMCAFTPKCNYCDVSLTYHRRTNRLQCHYCGAEYPVPELCPECKEPAMEIMGYGTERLEDEIAATFSNHKVLRMDLDTTRNKDGYSHIIDEFSQGKADILVGTQMVTKGLDFGGVDVVGVLNADSLINFPDFRAAERAFNMIEQVAGRAGRRSGDGKVIIQTYNPENPLLNFARHHDYEGFFRHELEERRAFSFPPFSRIINIYIRHRDARTASECAVSFASMLRTVFGHRVLGPQEPPVGRVQSMYIRKIMLKVETGIPMGKVKEILREKYIALTSSPLIKGVSVHYDVDPV